MLADDHVVRAGDAQVTTRAVDMARCMAVDKDSRGSCILLNFYIKPQRLGDALFGGICCILLNFYIKPQPRDVMRVREGGCILLNFYIKPQRKGRQSVRQKGCILLNFYIKPQLRQVVLLFLIALYLIEFLHQTTTAACDPVGQQLLYLIEFLHQTTTSAFAGSVDHGCILLNFYIKPQLTGQ